MHQLTVINDYRSEWEGCLNGDPIRPHIPAWRRVASNRQYFIINEHHAVHAVTCVAYLDRVPETEDQLFEDCEHFNYCCFYTIWSNRKGCGRELIRRIVKHNRVYMPHVDFYCTLSPKTEMAKKFHTSNGAVLYRQNELTDNYVYCNI